jgi:hypothetical protein
LFGQGKLGKVKNVKSYYADVNSATGSQQFDLFLISDLGGSTQLTAGVTTITTTNQVDVIYSTAASNALIPFTTLGLNLRWASGTGTNAPKVDRVEVQFEEMGLNELDTY